MIVPDLIEPVVGVRSWIVSRQDDNFNLESVFTATRWRIDRPITATCTPARADNTRHVKHQEVAPHWDCSCGIYAWSDSYFSSHKLDRPLVTDRLVYGEVRGWGRVIVHDNGWRAEHCEVTGLYNLGDPVISVAVVPSYVRREELINALCERYNVPRIDDRFEPREGCDCQICLKTRNDFADFGTFLKQRSRRQQRR